MSQLLLRRPGTQSAGAHQSKPFFIDYLKIRMKQINMYTLFIQLYTPWYFENPGCFSFQQVFSNQTPFYHCSPVDF